MTLPLHRLDNGLLVPYATLLPPSVCLHCHTAWRCLVCLHPCCVTCWLFTPAVRWPSSHSQTSADVDTSQACFHICALVLQPLFSSYNLMLPSASGPFHSLPPLPSSSVTPTSYLRSLSVSHTNGKPSQSHWLYVLTAHFSLFWS